LGTREQNIQVNVLSTTLLALLLLPWMRSERANRTSSAHLSIVGSGQHVEPDIEAWKTYIDQDGGVLSHYRESANWPGGNAMYQTTKLMVQYVVNELSQIAKGEDGR
jgi:NAD(P)-dependent dehydrogenase (short-subunit alcohol dehydrogenase family)